MSGQSLFSGQANLTFDRQILSSLIELAHDAVLVRDPARCHPELCVKENLLKEGAVC